MKKSECICQAKLFFFHILKSIIKHSKYFSGKVKFNLNSEFRCSRNVIARDEMQAHMCRSRVF